MEFASNEMIFTRDELQCLANGLVVLMDFEEKNKSGMSNFIETFNLLNKINAEIDGIDYKTMEGE